MSQTKRRAFNVLAASSAFLFVVTVAICIAAAITEPKFTSARNGVLYEVGMTGGHAWVSWMEGWPQDEGWERVPKGQWNYFYHYRNLDEGGPTQEWSLGAAWGSKGYAQVGGWKQKVWDARKSDEPGYLRSVAVATWPFAVATGALPAWWAVLWALRYRIERRRRREGLCKRCGYDLRASPERCPECGAAVEKQSPAAAPSSL